MQREDKANRVARKSDRAAAKATNNWGKAEYWQSRTEGVIANALYLERSDVRHRRIKKLEADLRKKQKSFNETVKNRSLVKKALRKQDSKLAEYICNFCWFYIDGESVYSVAKKSSWLEAIALLKFNPLKNNIRYRKHLQLRIAYEKQMLAAVGDDFEDKAKNYKVGGTFQNLIILKVNKSSGVVASVTVFESKLKEEIIVPVESIPHSDYREPTAESKKLVKEYKLEKNPSLLNLSIEDSAQLCRGKGEVVEMTQKEYTAYTKRYDGYGTYFVLEDGEITNYKRTEGKRLFKVRASVTGFCYRDISIIHLTDKAVKAMPEVREYEKV